MQTQSKPGRSSQRLRDVRQIPTWRQRLARLRSWVIRALEKLAEDGG